MKKIIFPWILFLILFAVENAQAEICSVNQLCSYRFLNMKERPIGIINMIPLPNVIYQCNFWGDGFNGRDLANISYSFVANQNPSGFVPSITTSSPIVPFIQFSGGVFTSFANDYVVFTLKNMTSMTTSKIYLFCFPIVI